jgi:hypothetical protein
MRDVKSARSLMRPRYAHQNPYFLSIPYASLSLIINFFRNLSDIVPHLLVSFAHSVQHPRLCYDLRAFAILFALRETPSPFVAQITAFWDVAGTTHLSHRSTILHNHLWPNVGITFMSLRRLAISIFEHRHTHVKLLLWQNMRLDLRRHTDWLEQSGAYIPFHDRSESGT